jgi:hypothetical protein
MSSLLTSLKHPQFHNHQNQNQRDEHGVAELLAAVSKRTLSCSDEEKKEIGEIVKRVQNYKKSPPGTTTTIERLQHKLLSSVSLPTMSSLQSTMMRESGGNNGKVHINDNSNVHVDGSSSSRSRSNEGTPVHSPTSTSTSSPSTTNSSTNSNSIRWSKELMRNLGAKLNSISNPLVSSTDGTVLRDAEKGTSCTENDTVYAGASTSTTRTTNTSNGLLRGFRAPSFINLMSSSNPIINDGNNNNDSQQHDADLTYGKSRPTKTQEGRPPLLGPAPTFAVLPPESNIANNSDDDGYGYGHNNIGEKHQHQQGSVGAGLNDNHVQQPQPNFADDVVVVSTIGHNNCPSSSSSSSSSSSLDDDDENKITNNDNDNGDNNEKHQ